MRRRTTDPPGYAGMAKMAYEFRSPAFSKMKRLTVNPKIVANGKQCLAATVLNVDKFTSMTSEDEAITRNVTERLPTTQDLRVGRGHGIRSFSPEA